MRINNKDETLKKNYIQKYQFLIKEYELVKSGKHKKYKRVGEFYAAHGTCRQIFLKYYGRYKNNKDDKSLLPGKRGPRYRSRRTALSIEKQVIEERLKGCNKYEINAILSVKLGSRTPSPSCIYKILKRYGMNKLNVAEKEEKRRIIKEKAQQMLGTKQGLINKHLRENQKIQNIFGSKKGLIDENLQNPKIQDILEGKKELVNKNPQIDNSFQKKLKETRFFTPKKEEDRVIENEYQFLGHFLKESVNNIIDAKINENVNSNDNWKEAAKEKLKESLKNLEKDAVSIDSKELEIVKSTIEKNLDAYINDIDKNITKQARENCHEENREKSARLQRGENVFLDNFKELDGNSFKFYDKAKTNSNIAKFAEELVSTKVDNRNKSTVIKQNLWSNLAEGCKKIGLGFLAKKCKEMYIKKLLVDNKVANLDKHVSKTKFSSMRSSKKKDASKGQIL